MRGLKARGKRDELYVTNALKSPALLESLSEVEGEDTALMGFAFVVFQILFTSPAREASGEVILGKVRLEIELVIEMGKGMKLRLGLGLSIAGHALGEDILGKIWYDAGLGVRS